MAKVWKVPSSINYKTPIKATYLPLPVEPYVPENGRLFSLYKKTGKRSYSRVAMTAYPARIACRVFGKFLSMDHDMYSIRPVRIELNEAQ